MVPTGPLPSLVLNGSMSPGGSSGSILSQRGSSLIDLGDFEPREPRSFYKTEVPVFCTPRDSMARVVDDLLYFYIRILYQ